MRGRKPSLETLTDAELGDLPAAPAVRTALRTGASS
jgi:hypothetical protein